MMISPTLNPDGGDHCECALHTPIVSLLLFPALFSPTLTLKAVVLPDAVTPLDSYFPC